MKIIILVTLWIFLGLAGLEVDDEGGGFPAFTALWSIASLLGVWAVLF